MNWVKKIKLPTTEAIKYNSLPCLTPNSLWDALHSSFNSALQMVFLLFRTSPLLFLICICSAVTIFFPNFLIVLVSLSNIPKLKYFTFTLTDPKVLSTLLLLIFHPSGDQYFDPRIRGSTWVSYSTKNSHFTNILITTLIKQYRRSNI